VLRQSIGAALMRRVQRPARPLGFFRL